MNTRVWKRFARKLTRSTIELVASLLLVLILIGIAAGIVSAVGWVLVTFIGTDVVGSILGGLAFLIGAFWIGWEIFDLFKKAKLEIDREDDKIMNILKGDNT